MNGEEVRPEKEFIGKVRHRLFVDGVHEWNGIVRDITAQLEKDELVNAEIVCIHLAEFYRARAHWANFQQDMSGQSSLPRKGE